MNTTSNILTKRTRFFNGFDIALVIFTTMLLVSLAIAKYNRLALLGSHVPKMLMAFRAASGLGIMIFPVTVKLIDPSDAVSLFATNIIYIAVMSRIFFRDMFTVMHGVSLTAVIAGVILITQPGLLFVRETPQHHNVNLF